MNEYVQRMNEIDDAMNALGLNEAGVDKLMNDMFIVGINGNIAQLRDEGYEISETEERLIRADVMRLVNDHALDEYAADNSDIFLLMNGAIRSILMMLSKSLP